MKCTVVTQNNFMLLFCATIVQSGMTNDEATTDMRNHMALYALSVLPFISICDKFTSDELFSDLISGTANTVALNYDTFSNHFGKLQDKYKCLGITCDMGEYSFYLR